MGHQQPLNDDLHKEKENVENHDKHSPDVITEAEEVLPTYKPIADPTIGSSSTAALATLQLSERSSAFPKVDECLAHLKLLSAFQALKEDVGYTDGLFGLWDSRCDKFEEKNKMKTLAATREKRWALYVARSVDRFQDWWTKVLVERDSRLKWKNMVSNSTTFAHFPEVRSPMEWKAEMLPPLDILMVWHTFMLNPRKYLEDCIRFGLPQLWAAGMPWKLIDEAIDETSFSYDVPEQGKASFKAKIGRKWDNCEDSMVKRLWCPACFRDIDVPWTTSGNEIGSDDVVPMAGSGYGDRDFSSPTHEGCNIVLNHDFLAVYRFKRDINDLQRQNYPMKGTLLTPWTGMPDGATVDGWDNSYNTFPNRLLNMTSLPNIGGDVSAMLTKPAPSMDDVKKVIEDAIKDSYSIMRVNTKKVNGREVQGKTNLAKQERTAVRKMMSCYWSNSSIFSIELTGAVIRQSIFVEKMCKIDWLHSPNARETMTRLLKKYERFIGIIAANLERMAVPTLDVDLAWHTHQLSPKSYYEYTIRLCLKFVNHDDKLEEESLATGFEWTSKKYQEKYREVYSECTCWYCETIRSTHVSSTARALRISGQQDVINKFHASSGAKLCAPDLSAHISSHNAVQSVQTNSLLKAVHDARRRRKQQQLDVAYKKAEKRAKAKGRKIPSRDEYYDANSWGYPYMLYGPWMAYPCVGYVYVANPCVMPGEGMAGNCVAGACGGGIGAGACGGGGDGGGGCGAACGVACGSACGGDDGGCGGCGGCG